MKVTGFTIVRNAVKYDYPFIESIRSVLPVCDDFVVAVGKSEDKTLELVKSISHPSIKIIETVWDESLREGGRVLASETDKAFQAIDVDSDWAFYIQADELLHEKYYDEVRKAMETWKDVKEVDGLLFDYTHFYGSYEYVGNSDRWYDREVRIIRNDKKIYSYRDAQGFRKNDNEKLRVKKIDASIYHYGWVKSPKVMQQKQENFHKLWHDDAWVEKNVVKADEYDYTAIDSLTHFQGTHPSAMLDRVKERNWLFEFDMSKNRRTLKDKIKRNLRNKLGIDFYYKNYKLV